MNTNITNLIHNISMKTTKLLFLAALPIALAFTTLTGKYVSRAVHTEIVLNLQIFIPNRNRPRPIRPKPHKSHAYKTAT